MNAPITAPVSDGELIAAVIERLRRRLIDVSKRNRMLCFKHDERSRSQVRLCAATLEGVYAALVQRDERLPFKGLPPLPDEPDDETTPAFRAALAARASEPEYRAKLAGLGEEPGRASLRRLDRWLRDRVRQELGLGEAPVASAKAADQARRLGIDPDFELGRPGEAPAYLQTLLAHDRFEPKLRALMTGARLAQQETGLGSLYAVFGFLEWYEDDASEVKLHAPLLLQPVRIERRRLRGREVFELLAADEEGAQPNLALAERLEDFGLALPGFDAKAPDPVEAWLRQVEGLIAGRDGWRVRRFLTVTQLSFARYVMYRDLDRASWPRNRDPAQNRLVAQVLRGDPSAPEPGFAQAYEVERPEIESIAPILVKDADSSQHSAIVDAMRGLNLVVEGPPGTGKSQTITNLIANALHAGKSVLFVAEKLAALEVVKNRLDEVGLGPFCLELHSAKAGPKAVIGQLKERLERPPTPEPRLLEARLHELQGRRRQLAAYVEAMRRPAGPEARPLHDLVWRERMLTQGLGVAAGHAKALLHLPWAETDPARAAEQDDLARQLAFVLAGQAEAAPGGINPWRFLATGDLQPFELNDLLEHVRGLDAALGRVLESLDRNGETLGLGSHESLASLSARTTRAGSLPPPAPGADCEFLTRAATPDGRAVLERLAAAQASLARLRPVLAQAFPGEIPAAAAAACLELDRLARGLGTPMTSLDAAGSRAGAVRAASDRVASLLRPVQAVAAAVGLPPAMPAGTLTALAAALQLVREAPTAILDARRPGLETHLARLRAAEERAHALCQERDALAALIELAAVPWPDVETLATALERDSLLAALMPSVRAAEARIRPLLGAASAGLSRLGLAALLRRAAAWRLERQRFEADTQLYALLGSGWGGIDAVFEPFRAAAAWLAEANERVGAEPSLRPLLQTLKDWPGDRLQALAANDVAAQAAGQLAALLASSPAGTPATDLPAILEREAAQLETLIGEGARLGLAAGYALAELPRLAQGIEGTSAAETVLRDSGLPGGVDLHATLALARQILNAGLPGTLTAALLAADYPARRKALTEAAADLRGTLVAAQGEIEGLESRFPADWTKVLDHAAAAAPLPALAAAIQAAAAGESLLRASAQLDRARQRLAAQGLGELPDILARRAIPPARLPDLVALARVRKLLQAAYRADPALAAMDGMQLDQARTRFAELDRELMHLQAERVAAGLAEHRMPAGQNVGPRGSWTEAALVNNERSKQRRFAPVRKLLSQAGLAVRAAKPCFLMSPLSVAQFLEPSAAPFDLLVMDEASQMLPEDALGSLLRARQVVVVGDPKQLPPTDFFDRNDRLDEEDDEADEGIDAESILDQCRATFHPLHRLRWHYRSRHESLIAFANREHYADQPLITFPAADKASAFLGLELVPVQGRYEDRVNEPEARAVLAAAIEVARRRPDLSLGIVTVNQPQRELLEEMLAQKETEEPALAAYREAWEGRLEPLIVKNLENIQGDERDVILVSLVYGPNASGKVHQRFGPIAGQHGHRRLNVLFTRARRKLAVFSSLRPDQIGLGPASRPGVRILRDYLRYAATGSLESGSSTGRGPDSDFELWVGNALREAGHAVEAQVGVAGYRIDLAVRAPHEPWRYVLGIECDGAAYHRAKSVRDRDRLRQDVLESLGWRIHRIWSTDWFTNPDGELQRLLAAVTAALAQASGPRPDERLVAPAEPEQAAA